MNISKETKRNIINTLKVQSIQWHGALDELSFLENVFNLDEIPSYQDLVWAISQDIRTEIYNNMNNPNYHWDFYNDSRFNLIDRDDKTFIKFLEEMLHPIVRPDEVEVLHLVEIFNQYLYLDGWEIHELTRVGNKPVFCARQLPQYPINNTDIVLEELNTDYIRQLIKDMKSSIESNPYSAIGSAKNFIEAICKSILKKEGIDDYNEKKISVTELISSTKKQLIFVQENIPVSTKNNIEKLLGNLKGVSQHIDEIRDDYGDGHGKDADFKGLQPKEARLAVNAAITIGVYLLETYRENKKNHK